LGGTAEGWCQSVLFIRCKLARVCLPGSVNALRDENARSVCCTSSGWDVWDGLCTQCFLCSCGLSACLYRVSTLPPKARKRGCLRSGVLVITAQGQTSNGEGCVLTSASSPEHCAHCCNTAALARHTCKRFALSLKSVSLVREVRFWQCVSSRDRFVCHSYWRCTRAFTCTRVTHSHYSLSGQEVAHHARGILPTVWGLSFLTCILWLCSGSTRGTTHRHQLELVVADVTTRW